MSTIFLQYFHNKAQVVSCYWFKFEPNTKITFLPNNNNLPLRICCKNVVDISFLIYTTILRGFSYLDPIFLLFQNTPTKNTLISLGLSRYKTKGQQSKNTSLTSTKSSYTIQ